MSTVPPDRGPAILFFSGGSALKPVCRALKQLTHRSIHIITPFDSGGSSAPLREAFDMLSVGDIRNRLAALTDESGTGVHFIRFLEDRFAKVAAPGALHDRLGHLVRGTNPLVAALPRALHDLIRADLGALARALPPKFDLRGASIGNLALVGAYLRNDRDMNRALANLTSSAAIRGIVRPSAETDTHLAAVLENERVVVGQHRITARGFISAPIHTLISVRRIDEPREERVTALPLALKLIDQADLITYPMGSFWTSVMANLVPEGVGKAISKSTRRKVYIPSTGHDGEQLGMTLASSIEAIVRLGRRDAGEELPTTAFVDTVLIDRDHGHYDLKLDIARVRGLGVEVIERDLSGNEGTAISPIKLSRTLLGL